MLPRRRLCLGLIASVLTLGATAASACISLPIFRRAHVRADAQDIEQAIPPLTLTSIDLLSILLPYGTMEDWLLPELGSKNEEAVVVRIDTDKLLETVADRRAVTVVVPLEEAQKTNAAPERRFSRPPLSSDGDQYLLGPAFSAGIAESKAISAAQPVVHFGMLGTGKHTIEIRHRKKKPAYRLELLVIDYREAMKDAPWQRVRRDRAPLPSGHIPKC